MTYSHEVSLGIVLLSGVDVIVDGREARAPATTVLGLDAKDSDAVLTSLESLGDGLLD